MQTMVHLSAGAEWLLTGRRPILFNVADVGGIGAHGERVVFGRSIVALIDPLEVDRVGSYELQVFAAEDRSAETADSPAVQLSISPWSRTSSVAPCVVAVAAHGVKDAPSSYTFQFHSAV